MQRFDLAAIAPARWKNGGGATRELACWPPGAGLDAFEWRVSVASIEQAGPFSAFAGVDRQIMLLQGEGVHLQGPGLDHRLERAWQPFAFSGETPVQCTLLGAGASSDLNLMLRRGRWRGAIQVLQQQQAVSCTAQPAGLCLVLAGAWRTAQGEVLACGQGLWWSQPGTLHLAPALAQGCALAWIALETGHF